ncbi:MAG: hypothetical protein ACI8T1_000653 [Verrucomicrobiales bacterium]|jgi:hypothetical protein
MQLVHLKNLLTFASFRPEPADPAAAWSTRFPNKRSLLLNVNRNTVNWQVMLKGGNLGDGGTETGSLQEVAETYASEWLGMTDDGWCSVSINNRFILSLETNLSRKKGYEELLRTKPKVVLGSKFERGKVYGVRHHPETNSSLLLACEDTLIKETQETLTKANLKVGRVSCGLFAMLSDVIYRLHETSTKGGDDSEEQVPKNYLLIAICQGSVCVLKQKEEQWTELRSRSAYYEPGDLSSLRQILQPMLGDWDPQFPTLFVSDDNDPNNLEQIRHMLPGCAISDVSFEDHLWTMIGKN